MLLCKKPPDDWEGKLADQSGVYPLVATTFTTIAIDTGRFIDARYDLVRRPRAK
jgi:hypothetical protein